MSEQPYAPPEHNLADRLAALNFVKEQLKRLEQVEKYLRNRGYQPVGK